MKSITLRNYRCFGDRSQTVRLAPLTILVGENSSGKTSFLAMIRALWDIAYNNREPDFKEEPFDLGSFDEIAHHRGARGSRAQSFEAGFETDAGHGRLGGADGKGRNFLRYEMTFEEQWSAPSVAARKIEIGELALTHRRGDDGQDELEINSPRGAWRCISADQRASSRSATSTTTLVPLEALLRDIRFALREEASERWRIASLSGAPALDPSLIDEAFEAVLMPAFGRHRPGAMGRSRPHAGAPVRSEPKRTYDPVRIRPGPAGDTVPTYFAQLESREPEAWEKLRTRLELFGRDAGLFDELRVRRQGRTDSDPFQIQVRKFGGPRAKGPFRNLVDVGYGVSQVLPVVTEVLRDGGPGTLLLQQPEVHLHPSAQAALGTLLCQTARQSPSRQPRQIVVETHSDFIIDRVRMAVADESIPLRAEDVSVVFFERSGLDVNLHSISVDQSGNIEGAPAGYRQFFLEELQRSVSF